METMKNNQWKRIPILMMLVFALCVTTVMMLGFPVAASTTADDNSIAADAAVSIDLSTLPRGTEDKNDIGWSYANNTLTLEEGYTFTLTGAGPGWIINYGILSADCEVQEASIINYGTVLGGSYSISNSGTGTFSNSRVMETGVALYTGVINGGTFDFPGGVSNSGVITVTAGNTVTVLNSQNTEGSPRYITLSNQSGGSIAVQQGGRLEIDDHVTVKLFSDMEVSGTLTSAGENVDAVYGTIETFDDNAPKLIIHDGGTVSNVQINCEIDLKDGGSLSNCEYGDKAFIPVYETELGDIAFDYPVKFINNVKITGRSTFHKNVIIPAGVTVIISGDCTFEYGIKSMSAPLAEILSVGYAFHDAEGNGIALTEGQTEIGGAVTVAPCQNHIGGTATCTTLAVCELCKLEYGTYDHASTDGDDYCDVCNLLVIETAIPDAIFRAYIAENFDTDGDGLLSAEEIAAVTEIDVGGKGISTLSGVEHFTELTSLYCASNSLTTLNVSALKKLILLSCDNNSITALDVRSNTALKVLTCEYNNLIALDLSQNTELMDVVVYNQNDVSITLSADDATFDLSTLDPLFDSSRVLEADDVVYDGSILYGAKAATTENYYYQTGFGNEVILAKIRIENPHVHDLGTNGICACGLIQVNWHNCPDEAFRTYFSNSDNFSEIGYNTGGYWYLVDRMKVTSMDLTGLGISNLRGIEWFTELTELNVSDNPLEELDLRGNPKLEKLNISNCTSLHSVNLSNNLNLIELNASQCVLTSLDLPNPDTGLTDGSVSTTYIEHCGVGYVNMNELGDVSRMEITGGGTMREDGWLLLDAKEEGSNLWIYYNYKVNDDPYAAQLHVQILVKSNDVAHTHTEKYTSKDADSHYTQECSICLTPDADTVAVHTFEKGTCTACGYACLHGDMLDMQTGLCSICGKQYAMSVVNGMEIFFFDSFAEAVAKAQELYTLSGGYESTIKILTDTIVSETITLNSGKLSINLNGHTLTFAFTGDACWTLSGTAEVTVDDTSDNASGVLHFDLSNDSPSQSVAVILTDYAILNLNNGTFRTASDYRHIFSLRGHCTVIQNGGTLQNIMYLTSGKYVLNDGAIDILNSRIFEILYIDNAEYIPYEIEIHGGTINVGNEDYNGGLTFYDSFGPDATITITGGTFIDRSGSSFGILVYGDLERVQISGGTFQKGLWCNDRWDDGTICLADTLAPGYAFFNENGDPIALTEEQREITENVKVAPCTSHIDGEEDGICNACGGYTFTGAGTEDDPYVVTHIGELQLAINMTENETNYIVFGNDITGTNITPQTTHKPVVLNLRGYNLDIPGGLGLNNTSTVKNGTVNGGVYAYGNTSVTLEDLTINGEIVAQNASKVTIENCTIIGSERGALVAYADAEMTVNNVIISIDSAYNLSIFRIEGDSATLILDGVTYTEKISEDEYHTHKGNDDGDCTTTLFCSICDIELVAAKDAHVYSSEWVYNGNGHWHKCESCDATTEIEYHSIQSSGNCTVASLCGCGFVMLEAQPHSSFTLIFIDGDYHYEGCSNCTQPINDIRTPHDFSVLQFDEHDHWYQCPDCEATSDRITHSGEDDGDCTTEVICSCGEIAIAAHDAHSYLLAPYGNVIAEFCEHEGCTRSVNILRVDAPNAVYDGSPHPATVTPLEGWSDGEMTVVYNGSADVPVNAGAYTVSVKYNGVTASVTYTITPMAITPYITVDELFYTGGKQIPPYTVYLYEGGAQLLLTRDYTVVLDVASYVDPGYYTFEIASSEGSNYTFETVTVEFLIRPAAPINLIRTDETCKDTADATLTGLDATMEYSIDGGAWMPATGDLSGLTACTVAVRVKATETAPHGKEAVYTITSASDHADTDGDCKCDLCTRYFGLFEDISISIGDDLSLNYYIAISDLASPEMRFTVNGYTKTVKGTLVGEQIKFIFDGVAPQWIGDTVKAEIIVGNTVIERKEYSVLKYLNTLKAKSAAELNMSDAKYDAMQTLIADLLIYGGAAQIYTGYNTDALVSEGVTGSEFTTVESTDASAENGTNVQFTGATVFFNNVNALMLRFTATDVSDLVLKVKVNNGEEVELTYVDNGDGSYIVTTPAIYADCFDDVYTLIAYVNDTADATMTYSVKSYVYSKQGGNGNIAELAKATYNYGIAAKAYKETA